MAAELAGLGIVLVVLDVVLVDGGVELVVPPVAAVEPLWPLLLEEVARRSRTRR